MGLVDEEIDRWVDQDRVILSELVRYEVVGMAYPNGAEDYRVLGI